MAYGLSASADGDIFPWVFNPPATYWDGLSVIIKYIGEKEGGLDKLKGKKIGYIYLDAGYGKEPIPLLEALAKDYGFELKLYPVAAQDMQNQSSQWLNVRRDRPDYMVMWGWGAMNPTAVKEAAAIGYPDGQVRRRLVVRRRGRRARRRRRAPRATRSLELPRGRRRTSRPSRTSRSTSSTRACRRHPEGQGRRDPLQPRRLQLDADRRRRSAPRRSSPARRPSPARTCAAASRASTSPRRA